MSSPRSSRLSTTGLLVLCAIPVLAGALRLTELATGAEITPANVRFFESPLPIVLHIVSVTVYAVVGAFQFAPGFRRRQPGWHRAAGRVLVPAGLVAALSGVWLTLFFPVPAQDEGLLEAFRIVFGLGMAISIVLGFAAIRNRDFPRHRAWMIRGYAIGLGAGTQAVTIGPLTAIVGEPTGLSRALLMGAGWIVNLAIAEWLIRRKRVPTTDRQAQPAFGP